MKIKIKSTGENSAIVYYGTGRYYVPVKWNEPGAKQQFIELAKWALRKKLREEAS
jgi:hypothetical protein